MRTSRCIRQFTSFVLYLAYAIGMGFPTVTLPFVLIRSGESVGAVVEVG